MKAVVDFLSWIKTVFIFSFAGLALLTMLTFAGLVLNGCGPKGNEPNVELIQGMLEQPALKAQDFSPHDREKSSMLVPPEGSWPKNVKPYLYDASQAVEAGQNLKNPYTAGSDMIQLGKRHFDNFCLVCHGASGKGDGPVAPKFVGIKPPSLLTEKVTNYPDGRIFHIITLGQGLMGTYIHQLPKEKDRWAVVLYVRELQKKSRGN